MHPISQTPPGRYVPHSSVRADTACLPCFEKKKTFSLENLQLITNQLIFLSYSNYEKLFLSQKRLPDCNIFLWIHINMKIINSIIDDFFFSYAFLACFPFFSANAFLASFPFFCSNAFLASFPLFLRLRISHIKEVNQISSIVFQVKF